MEGHYQLPIYIVDPRKTLPDLRTDLSVFLEKIPCASLLVRIAKAPCAPNWIVLSAKTVPPNLWQEKGVVVPAPKYDE